jgi:hypothetical protein
MRVGAKFARLLLQSFSLNARNYYFFVHIKATPALY